MRTLGVRGMAADILLPFGAKDSSVQPDAQSPIAALGSIAQKRGTYLGVGFYIIFVAYKLGF